MMTKINPGSKVICTLHPDWGVGSATYVSEKDDKVFIVWGTVNLVNRCPSDDAKYEICKLSEINLYEDN